MAEWVVYGQSPVPPGAAVDNPAPNANGLIGEVIALPYTVPAGQVLYVTDYGIEGFPGGDMAIIPWIGIGPATNAKCLPTCRVIDETAQITSEFLLAPGTILNVRLVYTGATPGVITGWWMHGYREIA